MENGSHGFQNVGNYGKDMEFMWKIWNTLEKYGMHIEKIWNTYRKIWNTNRKNMEEI